MKIIGDRIIIRNLRIEDLDDFHEFAKEPDIGNNAGWKPHISQIVSRNILLSHIINGETFCIALKENDRFIGTISLYKETFRQNVDARNLGFSIDKRYWGNGYAYEACKLIIEYAFKKLDITIIGCGHFESNHRSQSVIKRLGFTYEGKFRQYRRMYNGEILDALWYSMTNYEYERMKKNERDED